MAKLKPEEPTQAGVRALAARLARAYEDDELSHLEPWELTEAVRELLVLSRRVGIELDDNYHPVDQVINAVAEYDYDHASEILSEMQAQEVADRRALAQAEASAAMERFRDTAGEIIQRSGIEEDEFRSAAFRNLAANIPAADTVEENIENVREMDRQIKASARTIEHSDIRASIMAALPPSASPYGQVRSDQRLAVIQENIVGEKDRWDSDLENTAPTLTHAETMEAQKTMREGIMAHAAGPVAAREWRLANGVEGDGADV